MLAVGQASSACLAPRSRIGPSVGPTMRRQRAGWGMSEKRFDLEQCVSIRRLVLASLAQADVLGDLGRQSIGRHRVDQWRRMFSARERGAGLSALWSHGVRTRCNSSNRVQVMVASLDGMT